MNVWSIVFYTNKSGKKPVKEWIKSLAPKAKDKIAKKLDLLCDLGLNIPFPHIRFLDGKLYELRIEESKNTYRIIYFAHTGKKFILLNGFVKKSKKTPEKEIELAKKRMREVLENE